MAVRRFPPPWSIEELNDVDFIVSRHRPGMTSPRGIA